MADPLLMLIAVSSAAGEAEEDTGVQPTAGAASAAPPADEPENSSVPELIVAAVVLHLVLCAWFFGFRPAGPNRLVYG